LNKLQLFYRDLRLVPLLLATARPDFDEHLATCFSSSSALGRFAGSDESMLCSNKAGRHPTSAHRTNSAVAGIFNQLVYAG
jgi:hypothetical protein